MSVPPGPVQPNAPAPAAPSCAACAAPLAHDQRYCLECGEVQPGESREPPALLRTGPPARETAVPASTTAIGDRWPSLAAALAGLACLLLAMGVGVLIGRSGGESPTASPVVTIAGGPAGAAAATPASTTFTSDWPSGKQGWTIALEVLPKASTQPNAVAAAKAAATSAGASDIGALDADEYPSLTAGSYVVYSGVFDSEKAATAALSPLKASFAQARVVRIGTSASAPPRTSSGSAKSDPGSKKPGPSTPASDTSKAFEESKKAPKTVITPGTPPPKDGKPPAGGSDFEEIG